MPSRFWLAAVAVGGCALLVGGTWAVTRDDSVPGGGTAPAEPAPATVEKQVDHGPRPEDVGTFTNVSTGIVYVEIPSARIIWQGRQGEDRLIGQLGEEAAAPAPPGWFWGDTRDIVGDPAGDLVAWVERVGMHTGQVVVVQASSGRELARTAFEEPLARPVVITSVDADVVHFAAPHVLAGRAVDPTSFFARLSGDDFWTWRWASDQAPYVSRSANQRVLDVSGEIWAVEDTSMIRFEDASGEVLSQVPTSYSDRTFVGGGLSPGGRFWFGPAYGRVVETNTGVQRALGDLSARVSQASSGDDRFGWTGPTTMSFLSGGRWSDCDAETGACTRPSEQCSFVLCDAGLPVN